MSNPNTNPSPSIPQTEAVVQAGQSEAWSTPAYHGTPLEQAAETPTITGDINHHQSIPRVSVQGTDGELSKAIMIGTKTVGGQEFTNLIVAKDKEQRTYRMTARSGDLAAERQARHEKRAYEKPEVAGDIGPTALKAAEVGPAPAFEPFNDPFSNAGKRPYVVRDAQKPR